ncbi:MAG: pyruvate/2-oxoglutarate dehydrogenase complex dihydrolipoamide acyltransferase (E2) component [Kiritimatiellia bacterium]
MEVLLPNLPLERLDRMSSFRRIAIGTWRPARDPTVYGTITLRMDEAMRYLRAFREATGRRLTISHMFARAMGALLEEVPSINAIMRFHQIWLRKDCSVFFQVAMTDPNTGQIDLSGVTVHNANSRTLFDIMDEFETAVEKVRSAKDKQLESTRSSFQKIPLWLVGRVLDTLALLMYDLNINLEPFGIPSRTFGPVAVTNVGSLGINEAYVPLVPYARNPLVIALGEVQKVPLVNDEDEIIVGQIMRVQATFDHRVMDGMHGAKMGRVLRKWFEDPWNHFDRIEDLAAMTSSSPAQAAPQQTN